MVTASMGWPSTSTLRMPGGRPSAYWAWTVVGMREKTQISTTTGAVRRWMTTSTPPTPGEHRTARAAPAVPLSYPRDCADQLNSPARRDRDDGHGDERKAGWHVNSSV